MSKKMIEMCVAGFYVALVATVFRGCFVALAPLLAA